MAAPRFPPSRLKPLAACAAATFAVLALDAFPGTFTVTNCNDGAAPAPAGSLRWALAQTADKSPGDLIDLSTLACSTITLSAGAITDRGTPLTLRGPPDKTLTIDGNHSGRVLVHNGTGLMSIYNLTIINGSYSAGPYGGGCIYAYGSLALMQSTIAECEVSGSSTRGGAIYTHGNLTLSLSTISHSRVKANNSVPGHAGGAFVLGDLYANGSTISNNYALGSMQSIGGAYVKGVVNIVASTISGNQAYSIGALQGASSATISESTISGNTATSTFAGVMFSGLSLLSSTVAFNFQNSYYYAGGAVEITGGKNLNVYSSIIADNNYSALTFGEDVMMDSAVGEIIGDHNIIMTADRKLPGDTIGDDPRLLPLADNGGPTRTHALATGSPAINAGTNFMNFSYDQRGTGFPRVVGVDVDIGAFESDELFFNGFE